jgi:uncharacterized protein YjbI with pentapeptide repeats
MLTELTLSGSNFSNFIFKANSFCGADTNMPVLERLDLRSCQLNDSSLEENAFADCYLDVLDLSLNNLTVVGRNLLSGVNYFPTKIDLSGNQIVIIHENSGFHHWQVVCSQSQDWYRFLDLNDNLYCCNADMVWIRLYRRCITGNPPCYRNGIESSSKLLTFNMQNKTNFQCDYVHPSKGITSTQGIHTYTNHNP